MALRTGGAAGFLSVGAVAAAGWAPASPASALGASGGGAIAGAASSRLRLATTNSFFTGAHSQPWGCAAGAGAAGGASMLRKKMKSALVSCLRAFPRVPHRCRGVRALPRTWVRPDPARAEDDDWETAPVKLPAKDAPAPAPKKAAAPLAVAPVAAPVAAPPEKSWDDEDKEPEPAPKPAAPSAQVG